YGFFPDTDCPLHYHSSPIRNDSVISFPSFVSISCVILVSASSSFAWHILTRDMPFSKASRDSSSPSVPDSKAFTVSSSCFIASSKLISSFPLSTVTPLLKDTLYGCGKASVRKHDFYLIFRLHLLHTAHYTLLRKLTNKTVSSVKDSVRA